MNTTDAQLRWMLHRDIGRCAEIDGEWSDSDFVGLLVSGRHTVGQVAEINGRIVGFNIAHFSGEYIELLRLAVHEDYMGRYVGSQMIGNLIGRLNGKRRRAMFCRLPMEMVGANDFLRACGFKAVHRDLTRDEVVMEYRI